MEEKLVLEETVGCKSGNCPKIYKTNRGTYVIQGYVSQDVLESIQLPNGETAVEIPADLLGSFKAGQ